MLLSKHKLSGLGWSKISPTLYERPIGENERFIKFIGDRAHAFGREQWSVTAIATFSFEVTGSSNDGSVACISSSEVREAWKLLRFRHPSLASRPTADGKLQYSVPILPADLEQWVDDTLTVIHNPEITADDLISSFKPTPLATLYFMVAQGQIVLHTAHWRTDGYGAVHLIEAFFECLQMVVDARTGQGQTEYLICPWGDEVTRLVPSLETALSLPLEGPSDDIEKVARGYLATGRHLAGTVGVSQHVDVNVRPQGTRHIQLQLSEAETKSLISTYQNQGVTLSSAVHAALATANFELASSSSTKGPDRHYTSTIRLNLRPNLPAPYNEASGASGLYTGGYMFRVPENSSLIDLARQYETEYKSGVTDAFLESRRKYAQIAFEMLSSGGPPPPSVSNVDISIIEDVDKMMRERRETKIGFLKIIDIGLGVETLTRQAYCFVWTFGGRLQLSLWFNQAYYKQEESMVILERVRDVLCRGRLHE